MRDNIKDSLTRLSIVTLLFLMCFAVLYELHQHQVNKDIRWCLIDGQVVNCDEWKYND